MATLTLRVAKSKSSREVKKSPLEALPKDFLKSLEGCLDANYTDLLSELDSVTSLDAQITILQQRVEDELIAGVTSNPSESLQYLLLLFFNLPPKSPLKAKFLKMVKIWSEDERKNLNEHFGRVSSTILTEDKLDSLTSVKNIVTLLECSETNLHQVIGPSLPFTDYVKSGMSRAVESIRNTQLSSLQKLRLYEYIHDCVRALLLIINSFPLETAQNISAQDFLSILETLIHDPEVPLDTKLNCGLLSLRIIFEARGEAEFVRTFRHNCFRTKSGDSLAKICYCAPLLNILTVPELERLSIFEQVYSFLFNMSETFAMENNTVIAANLTIERLAQQLLKYPDRYVQGIGDLSQMFLKYIELHIDHYLDTVKHRTRTIFEHFIRSAPFSMKIENQLRDILSGAKMTSRFCCTAIQLLSEHKNINFLCLNIPVFIQTYMEAFEELPASTHLVSTFCTLMYDQFQKLALDEWMTQWINPVLEALNRHQTAALEQVLCKAIEYSLQIIQKIALSNQEIQCSTFICLHLAVKNGLIPNDTSNSLNGNLWKGLIPFETLSSAVWHKNEDVRLLVLLLLITSKKTSQVFDSKELTLVLSFIKYNINNENSAFRQKFLSHFKKFLLRFRDSFATLQRQKTATPSTKDLNLAYNQFRESIVHVCAENLFPSANFGRRCTVLNILKTCFAVNFFSGQRFPRSLSEGLLYSLNDSYEENKALARHILQFILKESKDSEILQEPLGNHMKVFDLMDLIKKLASSTHPSDCVTAGYFLDFFIDKLEAENTEAVMPDVVFESSPHGPTSSSRVYLSVMVKLLEEQVATAEKNIVEAATNGPMYGVIYVIKHLLSSVDLQSVGSGSTVEYELLKVIQLSFRASEAVSDIVNNLSPEGHLPMDFTVVKNQSESKEAGTGGVDATSQLLLLCAWRTVKEVSLLFGELIERAPIVKEETQGFMTDKRLLEIGSYFMKALSQIKHRGAFEQAFIGFSKVCLTLWKCPIKELSELPKTWLKEMMTEIATDGDKLCATRRSAGVPFIIQALLISEHEVSPASTCFHTAMNQLLDLCESSNASSNSKIHALNILRCLFRSTQLGDQVNSYVARGIKIAVLGFSSSSWSERNSSTLLLSALLVRIFGVPRSKDTLTWKNKMTGRIFFMRYPSLYEFFLSQLKAFDSNTGNLAVTKDNELTIFPVLIILARLYPSSLEGTDSNLQLSNYVKYIIKVSRSEIHEVRTLAATAISSLITRDGIEGCVKCLFEVLDVTESDNARHGALLQLNQIILTWKTCKYGIPPAVVCLLVCRLDSGLFLKMSHSKDVCPVVKDSLVKLNFQMFSSFKCQLSHAHLAITYLHLDSLRGSSRKVVDKVGESNLKVTLVLIVAYELLYDRPKPDRGDFISPELQDWFKEERNFVNFVLELTKSSNFDEIDTILTFLFYVLLLENKPNTKLRLPKNECEDLNALVVINHDFKFFQFVFDIMKQSPAPKAEMDQVLRCDSFCNEFVMNMQQIIRNDNYNLYKNKFLAVLRFFPSALEAYANSKEHGLGVGGFNEMYCDEAPPAFTCLSKSCFQDNDDSTTVQALHCISSYLTAQKEKKRNFTEADFEQLCNILFSTGSVSLHPDQIRYVIAQIIVENYSLLLTLSSPINILNLMTTLVELALDDLPEIRESAASILETVHGPAKNLELLLEEFRNNSQIDQLLFSVAASAWILKDIDHTAQPENQKKVFDKVDSNQYAEEVPLMELATSHLCKIFSDSDIFKRPLPDTVKDWLSSYCNLRLDFESGNSLHDIYTLVVTKLDFKVESYLSLLLNSNLRNSSGAKEIMCVTKLKFVKLVSGISPIS